MTMQSCISVSQALCRCFCEAHVVHYVRTHHIDSLTEIYTDGSGPSTSYGYIHINIAPEAVINLFIVSITSRQCMAAIQRPTSFVSIIARKVSFHHPFVRTNYTILPVQSCGLFHPSRTIEIGGNVYPFKHLPSCSAHILPWRPTTNRLQEAEIGCHNRSPEQSLTRMRCLLRLKTSS